jgi:conjugative relaxase-like TrwC/TraI family protein
LPALRAGRIDNTRRGGGVVLTITKLSNAEYVLGQVAAGIEDYYVGSGEAPGVWQGEWAKELGLEGVVQADDLRSLLDACHPVSSDPLLSGMRAREVKAFDLTFSAPKSASLLWAFGTSATSSVVSISVVESADVALRFLERYAAVSRQQVDGLRVRVPAAGWAAATFTHRTSREGDPQLHLHCIVPNVVRRPDGSHAALDAGPMHVWLKAAGSIFQAELQRRLSHQLGVGWRPDRSGTRELTGFTAGQLRAFSKRTRQIEAQLAGGPAEWASPAARMRANDQASLDTRPRKDRP